MTERCRLRLFAATLVAALIPAALSAAERPNIVLILADDLGFSDLGCYGSEVPTPNLDRLAAGGVRFTQFYNAARCCPTRAALLTGLYPHQAGIGHMNEDWSKFGPAYAGSLNDQCVTIAQLLHAAGYGTYHVGKWHVAPPADLAVKNWPRQRGFDRFFGTGGGSNYFKPEFLARGTARVQPEGDDFYMTDALSDEAARFIREHRDHRPDLPFFLHLCYTAPHFPLQARPADIARYRGKYREGWDALRQRRLAKQKELGLFDRRVALSPRDPVARAWADLTDEDRDQWDLRMAVYAAMIDCLDRGIGRVLDAVKAAGASGNTMVLFLSDNGASAEFLDTWPNPARGHKPGSEVGSRESHKCLEVGWANAANTPFRQHKMWVHEGGIRTPFIAYWPAGLKAGGLRRGPGHVIDLMPTCLALAGAEYPATFAGQTLTPLPGRSLLPELRGEPGAERLLAWEHEGNRAVRVGDWKLVAEFRGDWELYNLADDPAELNNLAAGEPQRVKELAAQWQAWADRIGVVPWEKLPGAKYKPSRTYRKKSEAVED